MAGFRDLLAQIAPPWLSRKWGERFLYAHGLIIDGLVEHALQAMKARFPDKGPDEALSVIGRDRRIRRGFSESADSYRVRLKRWLDDWRRAGSPFAILSQIRAYLTGYDVRIRYVNDRGTWITLDPDGTFHVRKLFGNWDWDGQFPATAKTRFWIIIYPLASGLWTQSPTLGTPHVLLRDTTVGSNATVSQVSSIRSIISEWKAAGSRCPYIIIAFDDAMFNPISTSWSQLLTEVSFSRDSSGTQLPDRPGDALYWSGV